MKQPLGSLAALAVVVVLSWPGMQAAQAQVSPETLKSISTPDKVQTPIGRLEFFDGVPTDATVDTRYDNLDRMRGVEVFLDNVGALSVYSVIAGNAAIGLSQPNQIAVAEKLLDSHSLYLTGNTSTMYSIGHLDLEAYGPTVVEVPPGMLGMLDDAWMRYVGDFGVAGPDRGKGGKYLVLPPGYTGEVPEGYFVLKAPTYINWFFMRGSIADGLAPALKNVKDHLKVYPLKSAGNPPATEFVNITGKSYNTVAPSDFSYFEALDKIIQREPIDALGSESRGALAAIGIVKGKPFNPDARMKRLLTEAAAIGDATARAALYSPREKGYFIYPDSDSSWVMGFANKNVFFETDGARNLDARTSFYFGYTGVTPAMAVTHPGAGSDYAIAFRDSEKKAFDGSKTYKLHLPPDVPVNNFWAVTIYDTQTRSMLQTSQPFPSVGSQSEGFQKNADGSYDVYFAPKAPTGKRGNWLQTIPGKSWFAILR
ncbi:MAG: DUF1254 domain-containing protein, partial [Steroidobacteraceae bacterium]|nr:DUF1254 domain-containing protein [Steroidobacteraceae bacterium]